MTPASPSARNLLTQFRTRETAWSSPLIFAGLLTLAERTDSLIEMVPQVGDFVATGDPLFRVYQGDTSLPMGALLQSVCVGDERTTEQDPTFVFRILVDIASKGLSPAINDPTTAVLAIDQVHHLLRTRGQPAPGRRTGTRFLGPASARVSDSGLGGFHPARGHRNPPLRRPEHSGGQTIAGHAGEPYPDPARKSPLTCCVGSWLSCIAQQSDSLMSLRTEPLADVGDFQGVGGRPSPSQGGDASQRENATMSSRVVN